MTDDRGLKDWSEATYLCLSAVSFPGGGFGVYQREFFKIKKAKKRQIDLKNKDF